MKRITLWLRIHRDLLPALVGVPCALLAVWFTL